MRKILIITLILFFNLPLLLMAQNTGFAGKRVLLKSNAINGVQGFFNSYAAELAFHRKMTITVAYDAINADIRQSYHPMETLGSSIVMDAKAQTSYRGMMIEYRKYFSREKPAPYGLFISASFANGNLNIEKGTYAEKAFITGGTQDVIYQINGINTSRLSLGLGYQKPINKWLFVGWQLSFDYTRFGNLISGLPQQAASGVLKNYGSNVLFMNFYDEDKPIQDQQMRTYGISGKIQLGMMIF